MKQFKIIYNENISKHELVYQKQEKSKIKKEAERNAKLDSCILCGKNCSSFENSHSIPQFILRSITKEGKAVSINAALKDPAEKNKLDYVN